MKKRNTNIPAAYLVLIEKGQILLLKRFNTGFEDGKYSMIAGHVDEGETFSQAIVREACEEAGIKIKPENLKLVHVMHRKSNQEQRVDLFFIAEKYEGMIENKEPHKCSSLEWFDLDKIPENAIGYIKKAIANIKNKISYSEDAWQ